MEQDGENIIIIVYIMVEVEVPRMVLKYKKVSRTGEMSLCRRFFIIAKQPWRFIFSYANWSENSDS